MDLNNNNKINADNDNNLQDEHKDYIAGENFYMFTPQVEETNEKATQTNYVNTNYSVPKKEKVKRKKGTFRRAMSYVLVGTICATIGAGAALG
ncbi:MAG TPA: hypothetical protein DGK91_06915, partial [Clostridium sp.]|nr:hypothetical protein [Clostridium sp.]